MHLVGLRFQRLPSRRQLWSLRAQNTLRSWLLVIFAIVLLAVVAGCRRADTGPATESKELVVFAAASLTEVFGELAQRFESDNPGVTVVLNLAGSQQLAHQLSQGAPADVFASANEEQMAMAIEVGRVKEGSQQRFAGNELTLIFPVGNPAGLRTLSDLARPGIRLILAAPEVPAGQYAQTFFSTAAADPGFGPIFADRALANVVSYEENVRAVLSKVRLGEADAGIVYRSDVSPDLSAEVGQLLIPQSLNVQATYSIAPLTNSHDLDLAGTFIDFVLSDQGQELLVAHGLEAAAAE